jgi:DNA invertase Pin-like site-specific DNA recombinase
MADYATLVEKAIDRKWNLAVIDLNADLSTPSGELMGTMTAAFARQERRLISQRTKDALAVLKAQGVTLGRPVVLPQAVADRIVASRNAGMGWSAIARELNDEHVPTATHKGTTWHPSAVQKVALRQGAK